MMVVGNCHANQDFTICGNGHSCLLDVIVVGVPVSIRVAETKCPVDFAQWIWARQAGLSSALDSKTVPHTAAAAFPK
jgi:hypothetical protein